MEWHHPVTSEEKVPVDIEVAAFVAANLCAEGFHNLGLIEPFADPSKLLVAKRPTIGAGDTHIIRVLSSPLVGTNDSIVAVDSCGHTRPNTLAVVAIFNK